MSKVPVSKEMVFYGVAAVAGAAGLGAGIYFLGRKWLRQRGVSEGWSWGLAPLHQLWYLYSPVITCSLSLYYVWLATVLVQFKLLLCELSIFPLHGFGIIPVPGLFMLDM